MKKNMGTADRVIRMVLVLIIVLLYYYNIIPGALGLVLLVLAAVFLLTGLVGFCPLYAPFGWSTCGRRKR